MKDSNGIDDEGRIYWVYLDLKPWQIGCWTLQEDKSWTKSEISWVERFLVSGAGKEGSHQVHPASI